MAGITLINEDLLLPFTEETPVHANFMNPIIDNVNKNTSAIGQITNDRGYLNSKPLGSDIDLNNFFIQGKYYSSICLNRPNADAFIIDISGITSANSAITQKATCYYGAGNVNFGRTYERTYYQASGGWTPWVETANAINTPIKKNLAGSNTLKGIDQGLYLIYEGPSSFIDFPRTGIYKYGILIVTLIDRYKIYQMTLVNSSGDKVINLNGFIDITATGANVAWVGNEVPYLPVAVGGINITAQRSAILNNVLHIAFDIQKADKTNFVANVQVSAAVFSGITITHPKNIMFSCWSSNGGILVGNGGVGTLFVDRVLYLIPPIACDTIRITGQFILE